jgi:hypothetical protein
MVLIWTTSLHRYAATNISMETCLFCSLASGVCTKLGKYRHTSSSSWNWCAVSFYFKLKVQCTLVSSHFSISIWNSYTSSQWLKLLLCEWIVMHKTPLPYTNKAQISALGLFNFWGSCLPPTEPSAFLSIRERNNHTDFKPFHSAFNPTQP